MDTHPSVEVLIALILGNPALKRSHPAHNEVEPVVEDAFRKVYVDCIGSLGEETIALLEGQADQHHLRLPSRTELTHAELVRPTFRM